ncbi:MAG: YpdA family putative bacillithiol disulfide reductase [Saprospiraceae bacterium]|nr:YpdA family putative bacillithiol disulfide reductase [Saprospiraceae bacterium]
MYDLVIIGGGPTGINVGISAQQAGLKYVILEKGMMVNSIYHFPANMTFFSTSKKLEIGKIPFVSHLDKPTRTEALEYYRRLVETFNLNLHTYEGVETMEPTDQGTYRVQTAKGTYHTRAVTVATGFYDTPNLLGVPGEELPKVVHYYRDPHPYVGKQILIIGARNSDCDVALETYTKGAHVTMAIRGSGIHDRVKYWIRPNIENRIKEGSIEAYYHTVVKEIRPYEVVLVGPEGPFIIPNDFVLAMTGYQPNYKFLERLGIVWPEDDLKIPRHDQENLESNLPNVYLAGVVCGGMQTNRLFIENTRDHGHIIIEDILRKQKNTAALGA